ncbi:MAG: STAS domain-containing protein [Micromonosporaceae bacterium]|nr:STAS domain-containing protein [Micromonosporaceae bacterium]
MDFTITQRNRDDGAAHLILAGEIDLAVADEVRQAIVDAILAHPVAGVVVDLDQVTLLGSTGISALVAGRQKAIETDTGYRVINPHGVVRKVLAITGVLPTLVSDPGTSTSLPR